MRSASTTPRAVSQRAITARSPVSVAICSADSALGTMIVR